MSLFLQILLSNHISIIQIIIVAYIGALIGEAQKEIDDDDKVNILAFFMSWVSSGFVGTMVGCLLQGTVAKDNGYVVLGGSGVAGFMGRKQSLQLVTRIILNSVKEASKSLNENDKDNDKNEEKK